MKGTEQQLIQHFNNHGKTDSWLNLANQFNILPQGTNKQKSDKVRRLASSSYMSPAHHIPETTVYSGSNYNYIKSDPYTYNTGLLPSTGSLGIYQAPYIVPAGGATSVPQVDNDYLEFLKWKEERNKFQQPIKKSLPQPYTKGDPNNVLVIPDLHLPFELDGALEFCREQQERFNCGTVIFLGDLCDFHAQSFHTSDSDGSSALDELNLAVEKLQDWYQVFPKATITLGNHDRIIARKLFSVGLSKRWMKPLGDVLNTPNWEFVEQVIHNNVLYIHGEGGTAYKKAQTEMMSVVQGHLHTEGYIQFLPGIGGNRFAMQAGTLINFNTYAFAYASRGKRPVLSCGVVLNNHPILIPYNA